MKLLSVIFVSLFIVSCSTIHIVNEDESFDDSKKNQRFESWTDFSRWHHVGVFSLVEFSDPIQLDKVCEDKSTKWSRITIRRDAPQILLDLGMEILLSGSSAAYSPWAIDYSCTK